MLCYLLLTVLALPALAQDRNDYWWEDRADDSLEELFFDGFFFPGFFFPGFFFDEDEDFDRFDFADGISQETEQEAESGDVTQDFDVSRTGANSN